MQEETPQVQGNTRTADQEYAHSGAVARMGATAETIEAMVADYIQGQGGPRQAAQASAKQQFHHAPHGAQASAVQLAISYAIQHHAHQPGHLARGHIKRFYNGDMSRVSAFLLQYPEAATGLPQRAQDQTWNQQQLMQDITKLVMEDDVDHAVLELKHKIGNPQTIEEIIAALTRIAHSGAWENQPQAGRLKILAAAVIASDNPEQALQDLMRQGLNLHEALDPQHLEKAMATALIAWEALQDWTTPRTTDGRLRPMAQTPEPRGDAQRREEGLRGIGPRQGTHYGRRTQVLQLSDFQGLRVAYPPPPPM